MDTITIKSMEDIHNIEKVPFEDRLKAGNVYDLLKKGSEINQDATAITFFFNGEQYENPMDISYRDFFLGVNSAANMFYDLGVRSDDKVAYILGNFPQTHYTLWGAETAGIACPINPLLEPSALKDILNSLKAKVLVTLGDIPGVDIWSKVDSIRSEIPSLEYILQVFGTTDEKENIYSYDELVTQYFGENLVFQRDIAPDDIASIYHTGGTTGLPKLAMRTHYNEVSMACQLGLISGEVPDNASVLCGLPLFHCNGTILTGLYPFSIGARVILLSPMGYRDPGIIKNLYKIIDKYNAFTFSAVPTLLGALLDVPMKDERITTLKFVISGAAPLSQELFRKFEKYTSINIMEGYGLTESTVCASVNPRYGEKKIGSVGLRFPYMDIKNVILDENGNYIRDAETNEIGVVAIKGPNVFKGYLEKQHNEKSWLDEEWFNTGDMGRLDEDGYLWLTGRKKELIIRGGHNIDPAIIEDALYRIPGIKTAAAVGRPDSYAGEVPVAYVELEENSHLTPDVILEQAGALIGEKAAIPKDIYIVEQIPLTPIGKVFKPELVKDAIKRIIEMEIKHLKQWIREVRISVIESQKHGLIAEILIHDIINNEEDVVNKMINEKLSLYSFRYNVEFVN